MVKKFPRNIYFDENSTKLWWDFSLCFFFLLHTQYLGVYVYFDRTVNGNVWFVLHNDFVWWQHIKRTYNYFYKSRPGGNSCFSIKLMLVKSISCKVEIYFYCWVKHKFQWNLEIEVALGIEIQCMIFKTNKHFMFCC